MQQPSSFPPPQGPPSDPPTGTGAPQGPPRSHIKLWGAVAAVVSAIAGVASAVAAFTGGSSVPDRSPSAQVTVTVAPPPAGGSAQQVPPAAGASATNAAAEGVRWSGSIVLGLEGIDLTQSPPRKGSASFIRPAAARSGSNGMMVKGTVALWTGTGAPTAQGCKDLLLTQSRDEVDVAAGDVVCLAEGSSPVAALKVTATHYDRGAYGELDGELTVWSLRLNR
ncbi:hypothetical protein [Kitasatospora sp. KL5]|uniref:hypothetical protein n=1 Tax=Kitasatospora sp. KL5 TaxID=3425125 RepID=UPI003D6E13CF